MLRRILALAAFWLLPAAAFAVITYDASSVATSSSTEAASISFNHVLGSGSNRVVIVWAFSFRSSAGNAGTSATFNGVAMTNISGTQTLCISGAFCVHGMFIKEADLPAAGTYSIVVTATTNNAYLAAGASSYTGVDQTTPTSGGTTCGTTTSAAPTCDVTSASGDLAIGMLAWRVAIAASVNGGETQDFNSGGNANPTPSIAAAREAGATSVNFLWSFPGGGTAWKIAMASLKAAAGPTATPTLTASPTSTASPTPTGTATVTLTPTGCASTVPLVAVATGPQGSTTEVSSFSFNAAVNPGSNRILVVWVISSSTTGAHTITVQYNGLDMQAISGTSFGGTGANVKRRQGFYLVEPNLPFSGTFAVVVTAVTNTAYITAAAIQMYNVNQSTPVSGGNGNSGVSAAPTVDITSGTTSIVSDMMGWTQIGATATVGPGQTQQTNRVDNTPMLSLASSTETGATTTTMSWTLSAGNSWNMGGVSILGTCAIATPTLTPTNTPTSTATATNTPTYTSTKTFTNTPNVTNTPTPSITPTPRCDNRYVVQPLDCVAKPISTPPQP